MLRRDQATLGVRFDGALAVRRLPDHVQHVALAQKRGAEDAVVAQALQALRAELRQSRRAVLPEEVPQAGVLRAKTPQGRAERVVGRGGSHLVVGRGGVHQPDGVHHLRPAGLCRVIIVGEVGVEAGRVNGDVAIFPAAGVLVVLGGLDGLFKGHVGCIGVALRPVVAVVAQAKHRLVARHLRHELRQFRGKPALPGDRPGRVAGGVLVVQHGDQKVIHAGQRRQVIGVAVQLHILGDEQALRVERGGQFGHERRQPRPVARMVGLEVNVDALVVAVDDIRRELGDDGGPMGGGWTGGCAANRT